MRYNTLLCIYLCFILALCNSVSAKDKEIEYYKKHLSTQVYAIDSEASAIVLYEQISNTMGFENNDFVKKRSVHKIIKVLKADALEVANVHVYYHENDYKNFVHNVKGKTYNLSGNEVTTAELNGKDLLKKHAGGNTYTLNFTMPAVKEGSIIDYSYDVVSEYGQPLFTWYIQEEYPKLESVFSLDCDREIEFTSISHLVGSKKEYRLESEAEKGNDNFAYVRTSTTESKREFWIRRNIEGTKTEPFVVNKENSQERFELQATAVGKGYGSVHFNNSWETINDEIWKKESLKKEIYGPNEFLNEAVDSISKANTTTATRTAAIYRYIRNNFKSNDNDIKYRDISVRKAYTAAECTADEINTLLVAMLVRAGITASPIILSTTDNISPNEKIPVLDRMDHIACFVPIDSSYMLLDASDRNNNIGMLPPDCYNGFAWVLGDKGKGIRLAPTQLKDKTVVNIRISDFTETTAKVEITKKIGLISSAELRKSWAGNKEKKKDAMAELKHELATGMEIKESNIYNENNADTNLIIKYVCTMSFEKGTENFFFNANLIKLFNRNPFKAASRKLPVEFPNTSEYSYFMTVVLPPSFEPDTALAPVVIDYNAGAMTYKRRTGFFPDMHTFTVNSSFAINTTSYEVVDYPTIREFFQKMIDDNNQMLVIKKAAK